MAVQLNPYLSFRDNAREAMEFYRSVFGGQLHVNTFEELHAAQSPEENDLVMHSSLEGDNGIVFMGSDTPPRMEHNPGNNISMSLSGDDETLLSGYFEKLSDGGNVTMPLQKAIWGDTFGMCVDRFGINWLVNISGQQSG
jgi:PhnB protein